MNCEHARRISEGGLEVCIRCGDCVQELDTSIVGFGSPPTQFARTYSRLDRFKRTFHNLRGLQRIPEELMKLIPKRNWTVESLRVFMKRHPQLKKILSKIPSVWYQLGYKGDPISYEEAHQAAMLFRRVRGKISFLVLVPWVLKQIGREDLLQFCKTPSPSMIKKYMPLLKPFENYNEKWRALPTSEEQVPNF